MNNRKYISFLIVCPFFIWCFFSSAHASKNINTTEAGFLETCTGICKRTNELQDITNYHQCLAKRDSEVCQKVPKEERMTCHTEGSSPIDYIKSGKQAVLSCMENFGYSFVFLFKLAWSAIQVAASMITDSETRETTANYLSSVKNYSVLEFYKAYREAKGGRAERLLEAVMSVAGDALSRIWTSASNFYVNLTNTFSCYNGPIQSGLICSMVLGYIIPGGTVMSILNQAARAGKISANASKATHSLAKTALENVKRQGIKPLSSTEIRRIATRLPGTIRGRVLAPTANIPGKVRTELTQFLNKIDPRSLKTGIEKIMKEKNPASPQFATLAAGLFMSQAGVILSKEGRQFLTKEIADVVTTAYAKADIRNSDFEYAVP